MSQIPDTNDSTGPSTARTSALPIGLAGALLLAAAMGIGRFAYTPLLPGLQDTLDWTVAQAGDVASANFLGYLLGALAAAFLVNSYRRRAWLAMGMVSSVITTAAGLLARSFEVWLATRFLSGVASAFCLVLGTAVIAALLLRGGRPQLAALHFAGVGVGIVISVLVVEGARLVGAGVFGQWGALGAVSASMMATTWWVIRSHAPAESRSGQGRSDPESGPNAVRRPLLRTIIAYGLFGFGYVVTATFIVAMARRLDHGGVLEPLTWVLVGLLAVPSIVVWQWVAVRRGLFGALRAAYLIEAVGVLLAGFGTGHVALLLGGALLGSTFMGITALGLAAGRKLAGRHPDRTIGWMTAAFGFGQLLGPAVAGRLAQVTGGFQAPSLAAAALLLLGMGLLWNIEVR